MLSGGFMEAKGEIRFAEIRGQILEKVIQYVYYKVCPTMGLLSLFLPRSRDTQSVSQASRSGVPVLSLQIRYSKGTHPPPEFEIEPEVDVHRWSHASRRVLIVFGLLSPVFAPSHLRLPSSCSWRRTT